MKRLTSRHHPLVAACRALARGRSPDNGQILLEGLHLVQEACRTGTRIEMAAVNGSTLLSPDGAAVVASLTRSGADVVEVSDGVLSAMSPVTSPTGIVAIAKRPEATLAHVLARQPRLLVLGVDVQDPGNVGAMARAAEAAGGTGLALCGSSADPFGWKALRGSMGSLLRLPAAGGLDWRETVDAVRRVGVRLVATVPRGGTTIFDADLDGQLAFLLGGEGPGLPSDALEAADLRVSIPMQAPVESLNVAVATALLVYEAARQRRKDRS
jgi:RNA methyltransferase, TrmH family